MFRGPTVRLIAVFAVALLTLGLFAFVSLRQIVELRDLQESVIRRNRLDSLQLLRIQNTLNSLAITVRDMTEEAGAYPIPAYRPQVDRLLLDLNDALRQESELAPTSRSAGQQQFLGEGVEALREALLRALRLAEDGSAAGAASILRGEVYGRHSALSAMVARLLVQNNESQEESDAALQAIYEKAERTLLVFVALMGLLLLVLASSALYYNQKVLRQLEALSTEKGELARQMIGMQESILRTVSRELHDDFGQILTAVNATLTRIEKRAGTTLPPSLREQIGEVREAATEALERARDLSQTLHPSLLETHGLIGAVERFVAGFERQSGIRVHVTKDGFPELRSQNSAIHLYRIVQEALTNVYRHAQAAEAWVTFRRGEDNLIVEVRDHGCGISLSQASHGKKSKGGLGIVAMRERASLLGGTFSLGKVQPAGTVVRVEVPIHEAGDHEP